MNGPIEVGQTWQRDTDGGRVRVTSVDAEAVCFDGPGGGVSSVVGFLRRYQHKPTIPLRIRVGVTADGKWSAFGGTAGHMSPTDVVGEDIGDHGPIVAWHWVRAEVPMPETEQGDVAGTVEQPCAGMPSDQKGAK